MHGAVHAEEGGWVQLSWMGHAALSAYSCWPIVRAFESFLVSSDPMGLVLRLCCSCMFAAYVTGRVRG